VSGIGFIIAAALGTAARWRLGLSSPQRWLATLTANVSGSFGLGLVAGAGSTTELIAGVAALGSFTTFSTLIAELHELHEESPRAAWTLGAVSVVAGVPAAWLGLTLA